MRAGEPRQPQQGRGGVPTGRGRGNPPDAPAARPAAAEACASDPPPESPPLEARRLVQRLRGRAVLRGCSFSLPPGTTALLGPNGAGKSVLLRALAGVVPAAAGEVWVGGRRAPTPRLHREVVYVPQFPGVHPRLSVRGHLERAAAWRGAADPRAAADEALERLALARLAGAPAGRLAAAPRRRLAIADAWVRRARVLLFDEPTADLDPDARAAFWVELAALRASAAGPEAVVVTTHLLDEVQAHCRAAIVLRSGRVAFAGTVADLARTATGRCLRLPAARDLAPGWLAVDVAPDGSRSVLAPPPPPGAGPAPNAAAPGAPADGPAGLQPRDPTVLDGYLAALGVGPA